MLNYRPMPFSAAKLRSGMSGSAALSAPPIGAPPPLIDPIFTGYTGIPGFLEAILVLGITGAAAYVGIQTGLNKSAAKPMKYAGWVGGVGSALMGLLYLGAKSGVGDMIGLPAVRVSPT